MRPIHLENLDKTRPVLVLTRAVAIGRLRSVTVAAITSNMHGLSTEIPVEATNGLDHDSVVNVDNVFTIEHRSLGRRIGHLLDHQEHTLAQALINAFDLDAEPA